MHDDRNPIATGADAPVMLDEDIAALRRAAVWASDDERYLSLLAVCDACVGPRGSDPRFLEALTVLAAFTVGAEGHHTEEPTPAMLQMHEATIELLCELRLAAEETSPSAWSGGPGCGGEGPAGMITFARVSRLEAVHAGLGAAIEQLKAEVS